LGTLWGDASGESEDAMGVAPPEPGQQDVECFKKVDYIPPVKEKRPVGHQVAFGILVALLVLTPGIWMGLWKLRQPPPEMDGEDEEEVYQDNRQALENLRDFEEMESTHLEMLRDSSKSMPREATPPLKELKSPRQGSASAVAMAPASLEDVADVEDNVEDNITGDLAGSEVVVSDSVDDPRGAVPAIAAAPE